MSALFKKGQSVYTRDGQKHHVREVLDNGRVLASQFLTFEDYDGSQEYPSDTANILIASELFPVAPRQVISAEVVAARAELAEIRSQTTAARQEMRDAERDHLGRLERIAKMANLSRLADFIDGKITHFVVAGYQGECSIKTWAEFAVFIEDKREKGLKLLSLFGTPHRGTEWWMNTYSDGSGSNTRCQPCCSEEEALQVVAQWLEEEWAGFNHDRAWFVAGAVQSADRYGKPVPQHIREKLASDAVEAHQRGIAKLEADLAAAREKLAKATGAA